MATIYAPVTVICLVAEARRSRLRRDSLDDQEPLREEKNQAREGADGPGPAPRADPQKVGPIRGVSRLDKLALQDGQSVFALSDQQSVTKIR